MRSGLAALVLVMGAGIATGQPPSPGKPHDSQGAWTHEHVNSVLKVLDDDGDTIKAVESLRSIFAQVVAYAPATDSAAFAEADGARRMVELVGAGKSTSRSVLTYLRKHPALAQELAMTVGPGDNAECICQVLGRLIEKFGETPGDLPAFTAAICVVYDNPHTAAATRPKETPKTIDPVDVFGYFVANSGRMLFGLNDLPPQLMVYMVDTRATVEELEWALNAHAGDHAVGGRYKDITYDSAAEKFDKPKKIADLPYTLENIRKVGGVCEEQAYFAAGVGKAIGDPATMVTGRSATMGHAWVGFLQQRGAGVGWNMKEGHYNEYEKLQGFVDDPQTGRSISDDELALTADLYGVPVAQRHAAIALCDAAALLLADSSDAWPPALADGVSANTPRARGIAGATDLLLHAQQILPCSSEVWNGVRAASPKMDDKTRQAWFGRLANTCGHKYPTFAYDILRAMIGAIPDPHTQSEAWDWAFKEYRTRADLASDARIRQGKLWETAGEFGRAYEAYVDVSRNFSNDGALVVDALASAERMLQKTHKDQAVIDMYADAFRRITRPSNTSPAFFASSNYYRVGERYARALDRAHRATDAANVRRLIERGVEKKKEGG